MRSLDPDNLVMQSRGCQVRVLALQEARVESGPVNMNCQPSTAERGCNYWGAPTMLEILCFEV
jgi:hypothetical protein